MPKRLDYNQRLESLAEWNKEHRELLESSKNAGCYYCCKIYPASEITEWIRSYRRKGEKLDCALCPHCGIDSVLPDIKVDLTVDLLKEMYLYWFDSDSVAFKMKAGQVVDIVDDGGKYDPQEFAEWKVQQLAQMNEERIERNFKKFVNMVQKVLDTDKAS